MLDRDRRKRQRATCIVELGGGCGYPRLLIARQKGMRSLLFPGGRLGRNEPVVAGALRELEEETGLEAASALHAFDFESASTRHSVVVVVTKGGEYRPRSDVKELLTMAFGYASAWDASRHELFPNLSGGTQGVLQQYLQWRDANGAVLHALEGARMGAVASDPDEGAFLDVGMHSGTYAEMLEDGSVRVAFYDDSEVDGPPYEFGLVVASEDLSTLRSGLTSLAVAEDPDGVELIAGLATTFGDFASVYRWLMARAVPFQTDRRNRHGCDR